MDSRQAPRLKKIKYSITPKLNSNSGKIGNASVDNTTAIVIKHFVSLSQFEWKVIVRELPLAFLSLQGKGNIWCLVFKLVFTCTCLSLSFPFFFSNVSHYSITKEILLYLVSFCPLMSITKIFHLFNFHCFCWAFCLIAMQHIKNFIHFRANELTLFYQV